MHKYCIIITTVLEFCMALMHWNCAKIQMSDWEVRDMISLKLSNECYLLAVCPSKMTGARLFFLLDFVRLNDSFRYFALKKLCSSSLSNDLSLAGTWLVGQQFDVFRGFLFTTRPHLVGRGKRLARLNIFLHVLMFVHCGLLVITANAEMNMRGRNWISDVCN